MNEIEKDLEVIKNLLGLNYSDILEYISKSECLYEIENFIIKNISFEELLCLSFSNKSIIFFKKLKMLEDENIIIKNEIESLFESQYFDDFIHYKEEDVFFLNFVFRKAEEYNIYPKSIFNRIINNSTCYSYLIIDTFFSYPFIIDKFINLLLTQSGKISKLYLSAILFHPQLSSNKRKELIEKIKDIHIISDILE